MAERRRNLRRHLVYYLSVLDEDSGQPIGRVGDISHEGLLLLTPAPLELWRTYRLRIMPPEDLSSGEALVVRAQCMWSRPDVNPALGLAGFRLVDPDETTQKVIGGLMREFGFSDGHLLDDEDEDEE